MKQQTTETEQKNLDLKSEIDEGDSAKSNSKETLEAKELSKEIINEVSSEEVKVETVNDKVLVSINTESKSSEEVSKLIQKTIDAVETARENTGATDTDVLIGGIDKDIKSMASATVENKILKDQVSQLETKNSENEKSTQEKTKNKRLHNRLLPAVLYKFR